jgi:hypothetical protein
MLRVREGIGKSGDDGQDVAKDGYPGYDREETYYKNEQNKPIVNAGFFLYLR